MAYALQSQTTPTLYHNGTILDKKGYTIALFDLLPTARQFETTEEAQSVIDIIEVPVNIVEV
jgi:hypothetical protein